jgi:hypothetical protein
VIADTDGAIMKTTMRIGFVALMCVLGYLQSISVVLMFR